MRHLGHCYILRVCRKRFQGRRCLSSSLASCPRARSASIGCQWFARVHHWGIEQIRVRFQSVHSAYRAAERRRDGRRLYAATLGLRADTKARLSRGESHVSGASRTTSSGRLIVSIVDFHPVYALRFVARLISTPLVEEYFSSIITVTNRALSTWSSPSAPLGLLLQFARPLHNKSRPAGHHPMAVITCLV